MNYSIKPLDRTCNQALLALAKTTDTGSDLFAVDRTPDFFALPDEWGEPRYYGAFRGSELIGCITVTSQTRFLSGQPQRVYYLHDLRVNPTYWGGRVYARLVRHVMGLLQKETGWAFATILDSNRHRSALIRGDHVFPGGVPIGHTLHLGVPLFWPQPGNWRAVQPLSPQEAWEQYEQLARRVDFAFADRERFLRDNGEYLAVCDGKNILAVCKIVDQSASRRLISTKPLPAVYRLLNVCCRLRGTPELPEQGASFAHGYLAFYAARDCSDYRRHVFSYLSKQRHHSFTYVFAGLPKTAERFYRSPLYIKLTSTTFAYGAVPEGLHMQAHELTMI